VPPPPPPPHVSYMWLVRTTFFLCLLLLLLSYSRWAGHGRLCMRVTVSRKNDYSKGRVGERKKKKGIGVKWTGTTTTRRRWQVVLADWNFFPFLFSLSSLSIAAVFVSSRPSDDFLSLSFRSTHFPFYCVGCGHLTVD